MGRAPCCDKANVKKGPWSPEEDAKLKSYIEQNGTGGNWIALPQKIGLKRCGKSCRLRWLNYLRPDIRHGGFTEEEENIICNLYINIGSRWSIIAAQLPGRTDNDIKNYWNTRLKKKLMARQRKEQAANRVGLLDQEIKRESDQHELFMVNQTLNQHNSQLPYWADPTQLSMPMINNPDDPLTRLLMKIGGNQFYDNNYQQFPNQHQDPVYMDGSSQPGLNMAQWPGAGFEGGNDLEASGNVIPVEVEAYFNNLLRFDQSYSGIEISTNNNNNNNNSANTSTNTNTNTNTTTTTTTTTANSSGSGSGSGSWGEQQVSDFDAYQNSVMQAM